MKIHFNIYLLSLSHIKQIYFGWRYTLISICRLAPSTRCPYICTCIMPGVFSLTKITLQMQTFWAIMNWIESIPGGPIKTEQKRIQFKILLLTFKALNGSAPHYISELLHNYTPARALRSQSQLLLQVPRFNTQFYGKRAFSITAPTLWNSLPLRIRSITSLASFQTAVKTHLFNN